MPWTASIDHPVPEAKHDHVGHPERRSSTEECTGRNAETDVDDVDHQDDEGSNEADRHDSEQSHGERTDTPTAHIRPARSTSHQGPEQNELEDRDAPPAGWTPRIWSADL
jgi:hypothetical protein